MLKSLVKALGFALYERKRSVGFIVGLALSGAACALGMGGINVTTSLGEPLKADIELVAVSNAEKNNLSVNLASPEVFKSAGMEYPTGLPQFKFKIETRAEGGKYIRVTTVEPVNEPFISLLVEVSWPSGKLLREYTFLLDPPNFKPALAQEAEVQPVAPSAVAASEPKSAVVKGAKAPMRATAPVDEKASATEAPAKKSAASGEVASGTIQVNRGDTLSKIANKMKPADVSLERMLVALYRANAEVFDARNMNRLRAGKILRMPEQSEVNNLNQVDSVNEIRVQAADWNAYRQKLAAASVAVTERVPKQEASGKISTTVADKAPAAKESAKEVVRLSKGEAPGDKTAGGGNAAKQDKAHQEEEAIAKSKELKESSERIAMLEKNAKAMQRLIELKSQSVTKPEAKQEPEKFSVKPEILAPVAAVASAIASTSAVESTSAVASASAVSVASEVQATAKPVVKQVAKPEPAPPSQPSLLDEVLGNPLYLAGGAIALLAMVGLGFAQARRRKAGEFSGEEGVTGTSSRILAPAVPSPETGDFTGSVTPPAAAHVVQPDEVDPISEAELFLNFGRDVQAEEILKDALDRNPSNLPVMLKLMSIYANRKNTILFSSYAHQVKDSGDAAAWEQAAEMGRKLEPDNPLYGGEGSKPEIGAAPDMFMKEQSAPVVDFDLDLGAQEVAPVSGASSAAQTMLMPQVDFDLGFEEPETQLGESTLVMPPGELSQREADFRVEGAIKNSQSGAQLTSLDFDVTATNPGLSVPDAHQAEVAATNLEEMNIDEGAVRPELSAMAEGEAVVNAPTNAKEEGAFMLDIPFEDKAADDNSKVAPMPFETRKAMDIDLGDISLDMDDHAAPVAEVRDASWHDVATKLDLAKAYQEMGDAAGAREILDEVVREGDAQQREAAEAILKQLPA